MPESAVTLSPRLLVVDDDATVRSLLRDYLGGHGFDVVEAGDGAALRALLGAGNFRPDLVLLDIGLPGEDGLTLARFLREHHDLPVIIVSGADSPVDRIIGLEVGADDYLCKPFDPRELLARIKSVLRRYARTTDANNLPADVSAGDYIALGRCRLNRDARQLFDTNNCEVALTAMEFDLLDAFLSSPNRPLSRDQLLNATQNRDWDPFDRSIDIRVTRLRRKLELDPDKPQLIRTVRGVGYMLVLAR